MPIDPSFVEISQYQGEGYLPLVDYEAWRVAILRYCEELRAERLEKMQRHDQTDEVFVLLAGRCILFVGSGEDRVESVHALDMEPLKLYNIKKHVWHTHTLSRDATVLIIENQDTGKHNSPEVELNQEQRAYLKVFTAELWK